MRAGRQGLSAVVTHTAAVPQWLLAALACILLQPLLARSSDARLLVSAGGAAPPPTFTARSHGLEHRLSRPGCERASQGLLPRLGRALA